MSDGHMYVKLDTESVLSACKEGECKLAFLIESYTQVLPERIVVEEICVLPRSATTCLHRMLTEESFFGPRCVDVCFASATINLEWNTSAVNNIADALFPLGYHIEHTGCTVHIRSTTSSTLSCDTDSNANKTMAAVKNITHTRFIANDIQPVIQNEAEEQRCSSPLPQKLVMLPPYSKTTTIFFDNSIPAIKQANFVVVGLEVLFSVHHCCVSSNEDVPVVNAKSISVVSPHEECIPIPKVRLPPPIPVPQRTPIGALFQILLPEECTSYFVGSHASAKSTKAPQLLLQINDGLVSSLAMPSSDNEKLYIAILPLSTPESDKLDQVRGVFTQCVRYNEHGELQEVVRSPVVEVPTLHRSLGNHSQLAAATVASLHAPNIEILSDSDRDNVLFKLGHENSITCLFVLSFSRDNNDDGSVPIHISGIDATSLSPFWPTIISFQDQQVKSVVTVTTDPLCFFPDRLYLTTATMLRLHAHGGTVTGSIEAAVLPVNAHVCSLGLSEAACAEFFITSVPIASVHVLVKEVAWRRVALQIEVPHSAQALAFYWNGYFHSSLTIEAEKYQQQFLHLLEFDDLHQPGETLPLLVVTLPTYQTIEKTARVPIGPLSIPETATTYLFDDALELRVQRPYIALTVEITAIKVYHNHHGITAMLPYRPGDDSGDNFSDISSEKNDDELSSNPATMITQVELESSKMYDGSELADVPETISIIARDKPSLDQQIQPRTKDYSMSASATTATNPPSSRRKNSRHSYAFDASHEEIQVCWVGTGDLMSDDHIVDTTSIPTMRVEARVLQSGGDVVCSTRSSILKIPRIALEAFQSSKYQEAPKLTTFIVELECERTHAVSVTEPLAWICNASRYFCMPICDSLAIIPSWFGAHITWQPTEQLAAWQDERGCISGAIFVWNSSESRVFDSRYENETSNDWDEIINK